MHLLSSLLNTLVFHITFHSSSQKMLSLPSPSPSPSETSQTHNLNQIIIPTQNTNQNIPTLKRPSFDTNYNTKPSKFRQPQPRQTNPAVWFGAIICLIFSLLLIFFGVATLIIFLNIRPTIPLFDTPNARLNSIYIGSPEYFNGDFTLLANFSNPNKKIDVRFELLDIELYFSDRLIAARSLQPFTQRQGEVRLESVHMVSSLVHLPQIFAMELQKQVVTNKVYYNVRGTFKVRATMGLIHYSYWLHSRCQLEMTGPPLGVLVARSCKTKR